MFPECVLQQSGDRHNRAKMRTVLYKHYPLVVSVCVCIFLVALCLMLSVKKNQGHLIYALDDAYIHMAIAKNFVQHGVWGATKYGFNSSSSPILWLLLLSLDYFLFGINDIAPLLLNIICAILVCIVSYTFLRKQKIQPLLTCVILLGVIFFTPLIPMVFSGMEHTLHILLTILFFSLAIETLSEENRNIFKRRTLLLLAPLLAATRYEGAFLIFVVCCLLAVKRQLWYACYVGAIGIAPLVIYGIISVAKGWYFVPTAFLLKCGWIVYFLSKGSIMLFVRFFYNKILNASHMLLLVTSMLFVYSVRLNKLRGRMMLWERKQLMIGIFLAITFLHMQFAEVGWYYRYEAYLVCLWVLLIGVMLGEYLPGRIFFGNVKEIALKCGVIVLFLVFFAKPLFNRGRVSLVQIPLATHNIYEQQYQVGLFLQKFYPNASIAANDVGIMSYFTDLKVLDLYGLISVEVMDAKLRHKHTTETIRSLLAQRNIKIVVVGNHWLAPDGGLPQEWIRAGQWKIPNNIVCGSNTVSFYAVTVSEKDDLIKKLKLFSSFLPSDVQQTGLYVSM